MITKSHYNDGRNCRVTFRYCPEREVESVHLVSSHDNWDKEARPMTRRKDGCYSISLVLPRGGKVQFRYLIDGDRWVNDEHADEYVDNTHGDTDGLVRV